MTLRIQVLSDLHLEFHPDQGDAFVAELDPTDVDVLVVAGDLTIDKFLFNTLVQLSDLFPQVLMVCGNHEYYKSNRGRVHRKLEKAQARLSNFHWLHETAVTIDGQRFIGTTLWFSEDPLSVTYEHRLNDFLVIQGFRQWVYEANGKAVRWLQRTIEATDVVVTHHVPAFKGQGSRWKGSELSRFYVTDLTKEIEHLQPKLWCYGHTHDSQDFHIGATRLVCNPFGYKGYEENPDFDRKLIVEV